MPRMSLQPAMPLRRVALLLTLAAAVLAAGCADTQYYWQSASGHLQLMRSARPVEDWLGDAGTPAELRRQLQMARAMRGFAVEHLKLPDNPSYHRYADLQRRAVVWNVVATPELSLTLQTWCFPVLGCVGYRGYYSEADARAEADALKKQGLEVAVYGVPAYSTLGWMNWMGGDPLLSTFIHYPEIELARIIFHELAHQVAYVADDTRFNESFATAVERLGAAQWTLYTHSSTGQADSDAFDERRHAFRALTAATRERLRDIYAPTSSLAQDRTSKLALKAQAMQDFRTQYAALRAGWGGYAGYDQWVAMANNASFAAQAAYDDLVPAFEALFAQQSGDWPAFYDAVRRLAALPPGERTRRLQELTGR